MRLEHHFAVPVPVAQAWDVLLDVERIAPCMPGATVESFDGETIVGRVKVKVGPIQVTYAGTARFSAKDPATRRAVISATAKEARGSGTATATITAQLRDGGGSSTDVTVTTDLAITGRPAQFGRGVMDEVGNKILGRFADCLASELGGTGAAGSDADAQAAASSAADAGAAPTVGATADADRVAAASVTAAGTVAAVGPAAAGGPATPLHTARAEPTDDAIDLLDTAAWPVLKRLGPLLGGLVVLLVLWRLLGRRR